MLAGKHFILCGLNALTLRVAKTLGDLNASISVLITPKDNIDLAGLLDKKVEQLRAASESPYDALKSARIGTAYCVLILGEDDLANLRFTIAVHAIAATTPVVLRAFDPILADQFESGLNVRRAFSVSGLSAPTFAASACGSSVLETLRIGDELIPISATTVSQGSDLIGKTFDEITIAYEVCTMGWKPKEGEWSLCDTQSGDTNLVAGMTLAFAGPNTNCLRLAMACNESLGRQKQPSSVQRLKTGLTSLLKLPTKLADGVRKLSS